MKNWFYLLLALPLVFFSCRKDFEETTVIGTETTPPVVVVAGDVAGMVVNEFDQPVTNAAVRLGSQVTLTDENGFFRFVNMQMNARGTYLQVNKAGYFPGSKRFFPQPNTSTSMKVQMLPLQVVGTISGANGGSLSFDGAQIELPSRGVVDGAGRIYEGQIQVAAHWLNPTDNDLEEFMPGNLQGINEEGQEVAMTTFGMVAIELLDEQGNELQIAPTKKATLSFPLPNAVLSQAPSTIPLWYFDEEIGLWVEEGSATLEGSSYVGEVSHFSFWNCDLPIEYIYLSGRVVDEDGEPLGGRYIRITDESNGRSGYAITAADGTFGGAVPANQVFTLGYYSPCEAGYFVGVEIGPFSEDTDIGDIILPLPTVFTITGRAVDCSNNPIAEAYVKIEVDGYVHMTLADENGEFSVTRQSCDFEEGMVIIIDADEAVQSNEITFSISDNVELGDIQACDQPLSELWNSNADGREMLFLNPAIYVGNIGYNLTASTLDSLNGEEFIQIQLPVLEVATYSGDMVNFNYNYWDINGGPSFFMNCNSPCDDLTVNITANGGPGGFVEGNYSGMIETFDAQEQPIGQRPVSGSFVIESPE